MNRYYALFSPLCRHLSPGPCADLLQAEMLLEKREGTVAL